MADPTWFMATREDLWRVLLCTLGAYVGLIILVRANGLRTFSKMAGFDFVVTLAIDSTFASTVSNQQLSLGEGVMSLAALIGTQAIFAIARRKFPLVKALIDNVPLLLMDGPVVLHHNLKKGRITLEDLRAKLREANVTNLDRILAVVLETTGDVSVLHGEAGASLDEALLEGVRR